MSQEEYKRALNEISADLAAADHAIDCRMNRPTPEYEAMDNLRNAVRKMRDLMDDVVGA
jgi:hypothetical protein